MLPGFIKKARKEKWICSDPPTSIQLNIKYKFLIISIRLENVSFFQTYFKNHIVKNVDLTKVKLNRNVVSENKFCICLRKLPSF